MRGSLLVLAIVTAFAGPEAAPARPVFFDDFDGNALLPHWETPPASHWQYNVSNSMLNVTGLFFPSVPKFGGNYVIIGAAYAPQADFQADVWMGWEPGDPPHRLGFNVIGPQGQGVATFAYRNDGLAPDIFAGTGTVGTSAPAPAPGMHHFHHHADRRAV